jgi:hypothetical protein
MSKQKIRVGDGVLYFIEKDKCSVMEWGTITHVKTYKRFKTEYTVKTFDDQIIVTWRNHLIKATDAKNTVSVPKALYDSVKAEAEDLTARYIELIESENRPVAETK